jgi:hypothetical protein
MPDMIRSFVYLYADDTKLFRQRSDESDTEALQCDLDNLVNWDEKWQLRFNIKKCKVMYFGAKKEPCPLSMSSAGEQSQLMETRL